VSDPAVRGRRLPRLAATIRDVARASRVSTATVSRVFNDSPLVSVETRERVRAAASRLGYWPNSIARSLITNRTHMVGVLMPDLHGEFFSEIIHGMDLKARASGLHILVSRCSSNAEELVAALRSMRGRVDGLIVMAPDLADTATLGERIDVPAVFLNPDGRVRIGDTLAIENVEGARQVVGHLIGLSHKRIAIITGPEHNVDARQRREGYRLAMQEAGLQADRSLEFAGDFSERSGYEAMLEVLRRTPRPTAVFAGNDYMAVGAMGALQDHDVRVPEDVAVVGFDDIPLARYLTPPLTTVHVDMLRFGERAVELLRERTAGRRTVARHDVLSTRLVIRGSCGAHGEGEGPNRWNRGQTTRDTQL
jgi:LacI family transcriptional regulator